MSLFYITALAIGLSADSFAVATAEGVLLKGSRRTHSIRIAVVFGICQGTMPLLGWLIGAAIYDHILSFAGPAAFFILAFIGGKLIYKSLRPHPSPSARHHSVGLKLWGMGLAVSMDALGVGISTAVLGLQMWLVALVIGLFTALSSAVGVQLGGIIGQKLGGKIELIGGIILLLIGTSFLL